MRIDNELSYLSSTTLHLFVNGKEYEFVKDGNNASYRWLPSIESLDKYVELNYVMICRWNHKQNSGIR